MPELNYVSKECYPPNYWGTIKQSMHGLTHFYKEIIHLILLGNNQKTHFSTNLELALDS